MLIWVLIVVLLLFLFSFYVLFYISIQNYVLQLFLKMIANTDYWCFYFIFMYCIAENNKIPNHRSNFCCSYRAHIRFNNFTFNWSLRVCSISKSYLYQNFEEKEENWLKIVKYFGMFYFRWYFWFVLQHFNIATFYFPELWKCLWFSQISLLWWKFYFKEWLKHWSYI